jgi:Mrp family chromosome partitioning ATPase
MSEAFSFFKSSNRKVLGTMTNMVDMIKVISSRHGYVNDKDLTKHINNTPFKVADYVYPNKAFKEYIDIAISNK